jgi:serine/threonine protein kinase
MDFLVTKLKIIHRDLKGSNIFLFENNNKLEVKIGDFGLSLNIYTKFLEKYFNFGTFNFVVIKDKSFKSFL